MEASLKAVSRMPHKLVVLVAVVGTNLLALYTVIAYSRGFPDPVAEHHRPLVMKTTVLPRPAVVKQQEEEVEQVAYAGELGEFIAVRKLPLGWNPSLATDVLAGTVGHLCLSPSPQMRHDLSQYMNYSVGGACPDDDALAQRLVLSGCEPLPRRRCFAKAPEGERFLEPLPVGAALWQEGRKGEEEDGSYVWSAYQCKSLECLNGRARAKVKVFADCLDCFDLEGRERRRWVGEEGHLDFAVEEVVALKKGRIRIGLDMGGGTGSFAVRMREQDVTIVTTTLNLGGPFNNFVARRGVVPLYITLSQRLPFWDNTLDLVHSMHVLSNWIPDEALLFIFFDIDRVLRPGGLLWLDHFFCLRPQYNSTYMPMIESLGYTKHKWVVGSKLDRGAHLQEMYLSALLEKPIFAHSRKTTTY